MAITIEDRLAHRTQSLQRLKMFFTIGAILFTLSSFSFTVTTSGDVWIMWRDARTLAATLAGLGLMTAGAAALTSRLIKRSASVPPNAGGSSPPGDNPYDVWHSMPIGARVRLALAVFPIFAAIGPIVGLMDQTTLPLRIPDVALLTLASGGLAASVILFGNRPLVLVPCVLACMAVSQNVSSITDVTIGPGEAAPAAPGGERVSFSPGQWQDIVSHRQLAGLAAIVLISCGYTLFVILLVHEGRRRTRLQTEVEIARRIQDTLLPAPHFSAGWCDVTGRTVPAAEVGGDYFDYLELPDGRVVVVLADVAGHGVGAGILSAMTKSAFRALIEADPSPERLLGELNRTLCHLVQRNMFVTMAYIVMDARTSTAQIATAGHPPVLHFRGHEDAPAQIRTPAMALGMNHSMTFSGITVAWAPGDLFLLYTDGVLEARGKQSGEYGEERLHEAVRQCRAGETADAPESVIASLRKYTSAFNFADDVTVVSVQVRKQPHEEE